MGASEPEIVNVRYLPDGSVVVRWIDPRAAFARYGDPALAELGQELAAACEEIVLALGR